jgi:ribosomal peptide maturation radical SAM protein 1
MVSMPFRPCDSPSIQLGTLQALARHHGNEADNYQFELDLVARIGQRIFDAIADHPTGGVGDWLFGPAAFGVDDPDPTHSFLAFGPEGIGRLEEQAGVTDEDLIELRAHTLPEYIAHVADDVAWEQYDVVGFTCTFQQNCASIALSRAIKARAPGVITIFGGSNFDGAMGPEMVRSTPEIDWAVTGEAERSFPAFLRALADGGDPRGIPGLLYRDVGGHVPKPEPSVLIEDLDEVPTPTYDDYFARADRLGVGERSPRRPVWIPFESSRGCWWGERVTCTFCALNGETIKYRKKSHARTVQEIAEQSQRYRSFHLNAVDNIAQRDYADGMFAELAATDTDYNLFFEIKSNLTPSEVKLLAAAGVVDVQPGIESLSSNVLALMKKGVRGSTNVNLLRLAAIHKIEANWNLLWGFPGERVDDYVQQLQALSSIVHLHPPVGCGPIVLERFSPMFEQRDKYPVSDFRPKPFYSYAYPDRYDFERLAFYFDGVPEDTLAAKHPVFEETRALVAQWQKMWLEPDTRPTLRIWRGHSFIQIEDRRWPELTGTHTFDGLLARIYLACMDVPRTLSSLVDELADEVGGNDLEQILGEFVARLLMIRDGNLFLSLAIPGERNTRMRERPSE